MKYLFPKLKKIASERNVVLTEVDLRWGITEEESKSGDVINICFNEIDKSIPFFIGIIGTRYGWCPTLPQIRANTIDRYPKTLHYIQNQLSITEMEMQYGVLERKETINACFFIRNDQIYNSQTDEKLTALKKKIQENGRYPVWLFSSCESLADLIEDYFVKLLNTLYPINTENNSNIIRDKNLAIENSYCQNYVLNKDYFSYLKDWCLSKDEPYLAITSNPGGGKTTLIANWTKHFSNYGSQNVQILSYYIGIGIDSDKSTILNAINDEISSILGIESNLKTEELFANLSNKDYKILIVLDGIDLLPNYEEEKFLNWFPPCPQNVKIIFTCRDNDNIRTLFKIKKYPILELTDLELKEKHELIELYLAKYSKKLPISLVQEISSMKLTSNPLLLLTLLDDLIKTGDHITLDDKIRGYTASISSDEFYQNILSSYKLDFKENLIDDVILLLSIARDGLTETQIIEITDINHYIWSKLSYSLDRLLILNSGKVYLSHKGIHKRILNNDKNVDTNINDQRCRIIEWYKEHWTHQALYEVPFHLMHLQEYNQLYEIITDIYNFLYLLNNDKMSLVHYWNILLEANPSKYRFENILAAKSDSVRLASAYNLIGLFINNHYNLPEVALSFYKNAMCLKNQYGELNDSEVADIYNNIGTVLLSLKKFEESISYYKRSLEIQLECDGHESIEIARIYNNIGTVYAEFDCEKSFQYFNKSLEIRKRIEGPKSLNVALSLNNIAGTYLRINEYRSLNELQMNAVQKMLKEAIDIQIENECLVNSTTASFIGNLGLVQIYLRQYEDAKNNLELSLDIEKKIFTENHPKIATVYIALGGLYYTVNKFDIALQYFFKAKEILAINFGDSNFELTRAYEMIALVYIDLTEYDKANEFLKKEIILYNNLKKITPTYKNKLANLYNTIGFNEYSLGNNKSAIEYYNKAYEIVKYADDKQFCALLLNNIARAFFKDNELNASERFQIQALKIQRQLFGEEHSDSARSINNLGLINLKKGLYEEALRQLCQALSIRNRIGVNPVDLGDSLVNVGTCLLYMRNYNKAYECLKKSYDIYSQIFGSTHKRLTEINNLISSIPQEYL